ncbi:DUF559 domain-containing protein [Mannheimia haemolytica]|uniref:DUF559 domain-containing protein n=1 Tax=Mannheimia haemolytica TaxID=75985 RepID=UPI0031F5849E
MRWFTTFRSTKLYNLRTHFLNGQGFRVLRFWNNQIHSDLEAVLDTIFYEITRG